MKAIVADVGADRGLLVSQLGFQSGANAFAKNTNITLTTLEQLRTSSVDELREIRTRAIADSTWDLIDRLDALKILTPIGTRPPIHVVDYPEGVDSRLVQGLNAWLYAQRESLKDAKRSRFPFPYVNLYGDQQLVVYMRNADEFLQFIEPALAQVQAEVENLELTACASASRVK